MLPICDFYNKFSILAISDPVEWVPDGPVPQGAQTWLQHAVGGRDLKFSWTREIFMCIRSCCRALKWYISKFGPDVPPYCRSISISRIWRILNSLRLQSKPVLWTFSLGENGLISIVNNELIKIFFNMC